MKLDYEIISFLIRAKRRTKILFSLQEHSKIPKQIAKECEVSISNVSVALSELVKKNLIKCVTPNEKVFRFYSITKNGTTAVEQIKRYNGDFPLIKES